MLLTQPATPNPEAEALYERLQMAQNPDEMIHDIADALRAAEKRVYDALTAPHPSGCGHMVVTISSKVHCETCQALRAARAATVCQRCGAKKAAFCSHAVIPTHPDDAMECYEIRPDIHPGCSIGMPKHLHHAHPDDAATVERVAQALKTAWEAGANFADDGDELARAALAALRRRTP